jgi:glycerophosphoryl diester phosphodiesterase
MTSTPASYAHRFGGSVPSLAGYALASLSGPVDGFEADVVLSADGEVLACHDPPRQLSTADVSGWAHQYPAAVLTGTCSTARAGRAISHLSCSARCWRSSRATLPLQLDIKAYADIELARRTAEACRRISAEVGLARSR